MDIELSQFPALFYILRPIMDGFGARLGFEVEAQFDNVIESLAYNPPDETYLDAYDISNDVEGNNPLFYFENGWQSVEKH